MARERTLKDTSKDPLAKLQKDIQGKTEKRKLPDPGAKMLNTRIPKELIKRIRVYCAEHEITIQDFITEAAQEKLG